MSTRRQRTDASLPFHLNPSMAVKHMPDTAASEPCTAKRFQLKGGAISKRKRSEGTNINTLKANHPAFRQQTGGNGPPITPDDSDDRAARGRHPRDSVGPPFTPPPRVHDGFWSAMQQPGVPADLQPIGLRSRANDCYRNAVLTMLINSDAFVAYARWHRANESQHALAPRYKGSIILRALATMANRNESQKARDTRQTELDTLVAHFWRTAAFPPDAWDARHKVKYPPQGAWAAVNQIVDNHQEDAYEFFGWLLGTIDGQLAHHHDIKDLRDHKGKTSAQQNHDWFSMLYRVTRFDCPQCKWRVQLRNRVEHDRPLILKISDMGEDQQSLSLEDCISRSFRDPLPAEKRCPRCQKVNTHGHTLSKIQHAPNLLLIALDRSAMVPGYVFNDHGKRVKAKVPGKSLRAVTIPEILDVSPWLNHHQYGPGSKVTYRLAGVVSHKGRDIHFGHYHSYVRGGQARSKWFELNDAKVEELTSMSSFDDSDTSRLSQNKFEDRFTPYIMLYEKDTKNEIIMPGFYTINVGQGGDTDARPKHWTGPMPVDLVAGVPPQALCPAGTSPTTSEQSPAFSKHASEKSNDIRDHTFTVPGAAADESMPAARVDVTVKIGNEIKIKCPQFTINQFDRRKKRNIEIEAAIVAPKSAAKKAHALDKGKLMYVDLMDLWLEAQLEKKEREEEGERLLTKAKDDGKMDDGIDGFIEKALSTWDRKRKRRPWPSRWELFSDSEDEEMVSKKRKQPDRKAKHGNRSQGR